MEDRLKILETENASHNESHQVVHEIEHMSDLHVDSGFHKQSMKIYDNLEIKERIDSSIGQSTVIQTLEEKRPKLSNLNQTQNRNRYANFENGSHFICSLNLKSPKLSVFIAFKMTNIASGNEAFIHGGLYMTSSKT